MSTVTVTPPGSVQLLPNEGKNIAVEFANYGLAIGETLVGPAVVTVTLNGAVHGAEITIGTVTISGTQVRIDVLMTAAPIGNIYKFDVQCPTSSPPHNAEGAFTLTIIPIG